MIELGICETSSTPFLRSSMNSSFKRAQIVLRALGRRREERLVAVVRRVVLLDEVPDVDLFLPESRCEILPRLESLSRWVFTVAVGRPS